MDQWSIRAEGHQQSLQSWATPLQHAQHHPGMLRMWHLAGYLGSSVTWAARLAPSFFGGRRRGILSDFRVLFTQVPSVLSSACSPWPSSSLNEILGLGQPLSATAPERSWTWKNAITSLAVSCKSPSWPDFGLTLFLCSLYCSCSWSN